MALDDPRFSFQNAENGNFEFNHQAETILDSGTADNLLLPLRACFESNDHLLRRLTPIFRFLKSFAFYGSTVTVRTSAASARRKSSTIQDVAENIFPWTSTVYALLAVIFNSGLFAFNVYGIRMLQAELGVMNVISMSSVISALKPLQNAINLFFFLLGARRHVLLWRLLSEIDQTFRRDLNVELGLGKMKTVFFFFAFLSFSVPLSLRVAEYSLLETPGMDLLSDFSLILVPLLSVWQLTPTFYYFAVTWCIQSWFKKLRLSLQDDRNASDHTMEFYYQLYFKLTKSVATLGAFFNPIAFFTIATSLVVLCLTIYFVTNVNDVASSGVETLGLQIVHSYFFLAWITLHILVAITSVLILCVMGWRTNERARSVMGAVLSSKPPDQYSQFLVLCFLQRNQTQWHWGVTVWRTFPVERSFLFTLISIISTYAVVLLKMQQKTLMCSFTPANETIAAAVAEILAETVQPMQSLHG